MTAAEKAVVEIARLPGYGGAEDVYQVRVDGQVVDELGEAESLQHELTPGKHTLQVRWEWWGSQAVEVDVKPGELLRFVCGNSLRGGRLLLLPFVMIFAPRRYLELRATTEKDQENTLSAAPEPLKKSA